MKQYIEPKVDYTVTFDSSEQADDVIGCLEAIRDKEKLSNVADAIEFLITEYNVTR